VPPVSGRGSPRWSASRRSKRPRGNRLPRFIASQSCDDPARKRQNPRAEARGCHQSRSCCAASAQVKAPR
jgi:hypothetical protein